MSKAIFLTGTGTDIGKTFIAGLIVKKLAGAGKNPAYYKAAMSGNDRRADGSLIPGDALFVQQMSGISQPLDEMCPYVYENAWSPHLASRVEGNPVDLSVVREGFLKVSEKYDFITMEGSGGILCPLCFDERRIQLEDVIREFKLSSILVADAGLGTINSVVLTAEYMKAHSLPLKGIIFNHYHPGNIMEDDNIFMCEHMTGLPVLAKVQDNATELETDADVLSALYDEVKIKRKTLEVSIPMGIDDDQSFALRGMGDAGVNGGPAGDVIVMVTVRPSEVFQRDGYDVWVTVPITYSQAVLGDSITVPSIDGKVEYTVPEGTQSGTTFRLRGKGIQYLNGRGRGDMYVKCEVEIPKKLNKAQRDALKKFEGTLKEENYEKRKGFFKKLKC